MIELILLFGAWTCFSNLDQDPRFLYSGIALLLSFALNLGLRLGGGTMSLTPKERE